MKTTFSLILLTLFALLIPHTSLRAVQKGNERPFTNSLKDTIGYKPRIINTTDLGADPDDEQSMVRQLVCANEFDIEGFIVATGCWKKSQSNTDMLDKIVLCSKRLHRIIDNAFRMTNDLITFS